MQFLYVALIKETRPRLEIFKFSFPEWNSKIQTIFFGTLSYNKDAKNSEVRLVINSKL